MEPARQNQFGYEQSQAVVCSAYFRNSGPLSSLNKRKIRLKMKSVSLESFYRAISLAIAICYSR